MTLERLIADASTKLKQQFGHTINDNKLKIYDTEQWKEFLSINDFQEDAHGLRVRESGITYIWKEAPEGESLVLHEYFGHGLYHELADKRKDPYDQLGVTNSKEADDEGFALWIEQQLANELGLSRNFKRRKQLLPTECHKLLDIFNYTEQQLTTPGAWSQAGLPYSFDQDEVRTLIRKFYHQNYQIELVATYGSQKPTSDLDLFIIGEEHSNYSNGWIDIYEINSKNAPDLIKNYDISVLSPLIHGTPIIGDKTPYKKLLKTTPISKQAIRYNLARSQEQEQLRQHTKDKRTKDLATDYARSYRQNARFLKKGAFLTGRV